MSHSLRFFRVLAVLLVLTATASAANLKSDFDRNGSNDIVFMRNSSAGIFTECNLAYCQVALWLMNKTHWQSTVDLPALPFGAHPTGVGDFNGDGTPDIVITRLSQGAARIITIWLMNGTEVGSIVDVAAMPDSNFLHGGTGDFDADGDADIVIYNGNNAVVSLWLMNGATIESISDIAELEVRVPLGPAVWVPIAAADMNGDGTDDIVLQKPGSLQANGSPMNNSTVWLMKDGGVQTIVNMDVISQSENIAALGDFDGNGYADVIFESGNHFLLMTNCVSTALVPIPEKTFSNPYVKGPQ
jgi:hypothetical protein